jgi:hypothetical protein
MGSIGSCLQHTVAYCRAAPSAGRPVGRRWIPRTGIGEREAPDDSPTGADKTWPASAEATSGLILGIGRTTQTVYLLDLDLGFNHGF